MLLLLTLVALIIGATYLWLYRRYNYWAERNVPHEKPVYFMGNMRGLGRTVHWKDINQRIYRRFKGVAPFAGFYTFTGKAALLLDLDLIKQIMVKDFANFTDRGLFHNERDDPLTANLLTLDGTQWRDLRHKLSPVFTTGKIRFMFPTMVEVGQQLIDACEKQLDTMPDAEVEAKDMCARYTTDVIGTCAFGLECNSLRDPNAEFRRMGRAVFEQPRHSAALLGFMFTNPALARRLRMKTFRNDVSDFFMNCVKETVAYRQTHNIKRNDFMDMLIELKELGDRLGANDLANGLTVEQVAAQAMIFFLAGFDTSSSTMSFCMYELALNPVVQEKLRKEILEVLSKHDDTISYECIKEMKYLEMVIAETLRKYSVLPQLVRKAVDDYTVPNTKLIIERGTRIIIPVDAIHNDAEIYPQPELFDPERFSAAECANRHGSAYLPFGDGPRNCIGMRFGKMQVQIGIIQLLQHFRLSATAKTQIPLRFSLDNFLVATESGISLKMERL